MSIEGQPPAVDTLRTLITSLTVGEADPLPEAEAWPSMIERIHAVGRIHRISAQVYDYFLEVLPPRWMRGNYFAFAEGQEPLQLFWSRDTGHSADYLTRHLSPDELEKFCRLAGLPSDYGSYYGTEF
jgi:hypothetical protein